MHTVPPISVYYIIIWNFILLYSGSIFWLVRIYGFALGREMLNTRVFLIDRHLPRR